MLPHGFCRDAPLFLLSLSPGHREYAVDVLSPLCPVYTGLLLPLWTLDLIVFETLGLSVLLF